MATHSRSRRWVRWAAVVAIPLLVVAEAGVTLGTRGTEHSGRVDWSRAGVHGEHEWSGDSVALVTLDGSALSRSMAGRLAEAIGNAASRAQVDVVDGSSQPYETGGKLADLIVLVETRHHAGRWAGLWTADEVEVRFALGRSPLYAMDALSSPLASDSLEATEELSTSFVGLQGRRGRRDAVARAATSSIERMIRHGTLRFEHEISPLVEPHATEECDLPADLIEGSRVVYRGSRRDGSFEVLRLVQSSQGAELVLRASETLGIDGWSVRKARKGVGGHLLAIAATRGEAEVQVFQADHQSTVRADPNAPDRIAILTRTGGS